ncbi:hypothetical protein [Allosphingosinicella vermicomposti]|uniref:hypothetical protein n=1 Tax=Allosphingosinicella vermicomposti TaxID=614671 RepID=UPI000D0FF396|nr:hypothetical protein [Allosphingosinicella vermicomposti]
MSFAKIALKAAVAASMIAVPAVATASTAASALSLSNARVGAEVEGENLGGGIIIPLLAVVALGLGIWAAVDDDEAESA